MAYIVVENFSAGLDTRRHPLTSKSGTLQTLKNAHVSRGGEIEKRKKFATFASLPANTFGMEATDTTVYVFGSVVAPVVPAGVTYQRLQNPLASAMTEVVYSTLYGGFPFVIAKFADGTVYPFWNGSIITDFSGGITNSTMGFAFAAASHMASLINSSGSGYSAYSSGQEVNVTGPAGVAFTPTAIIDAPMSVPSIIKTTSAVTGTQMISAKASFSITGGSSSVPAFGSKTLVNIGATPLITGMYFGNVFAGSYPGGFDAFTPALGTAPGATPAQQLAYNISTVLQGWGAPAQAGKGTNAVIITSGGLPAVRLDYKTNNDDYIYNDANAFGPLHLYYDDPAQYNGQGFFIEFASDPTLTPHISELVDVATIVPSPYNAGRYIGRVGLLNGGVTNAIYSIKVDNIQILGSPVKFVRSNAETMNQIVASINGYAAGGVPYTASIENSSIILTANPNVGSTANGKQIFFNKFGPSIVISNIIPFSGGVSGQNIVSQVSKLTFHAVYANGCKMTFKFSPDLDPLNSVYVGATRVSNTTPVCALTYKTKAHVSSGSSLFFSGVNQPTRWGEGITGAGFINMSNNSSGNEVLTALALYQGNLAAFARRSVQIWSIDPDPANNRQGQVLSNTGTVSANSVVSVGDIDVFYLSDSGVRSLRARDSSNSAVVNDVGTPIDNLILADLEPLTDNQKRACCAVIEPIDGRYWIAIGSRVYVYSYFPNSSVAAWSIYEPGFAITKFTTKDGRVYARGGDVVYLYGGATGSEYDSSEVEVILPYLDGGKPAHQKALNGLDMTVQGSWQVHIGMDPIAPNARDNCGTITQPTFSLGRIMATGTGTHVGIRLVNNSAGYARIANIIAHFEANESN